MRGFTDVNPPLVMKDGDSPEEAKEAKDEAKEAKDAKDEADQRFSELVLKDTGGDCETKINQLF